MDILSKLPIELALHIAEYLDAQELTRCLGVSTSWRKIVNKDILWRPLCTESGLERIRGGGSQIEGPLPLCEWAAIFNDYMNHLLKNWMTASYSSHQIIKEDWYCCIASHGHLIAVYYPRHSTVRIYKITNKKLNLIQTIFVHVQNGFSIPDLFVIDSNTIIVCRGSVILVYKNIQSNSQLQEEFILYKCIIETEDGLIITNDLIVPWAEGQRKLYVKVVTNDYLWVENDFIYVIDLNLNISKILHGTFRMLRFNGQQILAIDDVLSIFSPEGEELFILDCENIEDVWSSPQLVIILMSIDEDQILEIWDLPNRSMLTVLSVWKDPIIKISSNSQEVYLLEIYETQYIIKCLNLQNLTVPIWTFESIFSMELNVHPELYLIADKFLFARPSPLSNSNFLLLDCKTGHILYDSMMPPCLSPPCYIYTLTERVFITAESNAIHIRSYL